MDRHRRCGNRPENPLLTAAKSLHKCVYLYSKRILETEEEKDWLEKQDFHNSAEDAYTG